jgi:superfamily II DNA or RNA helicase
MNKQEFLASLQSRGLHAWQATFAASFLDAHAAPFHLLAAPPGTGKTFASVAITAELVSRGATRILALVPAPLCEVWRERLTGAQSRLPVLVVTRPVFREIEAALPIGVSPWSPNGIYVISQDLAKQNDLASGIAMVEWDLAIGDEAHRFAAQQRAALLDRLAAANAVRRLLLLSATPLPSLDPWLHSLPDQPARFSSPLVLTSWFGPLTNWDGSTVDRPKVKLEACVYKRGDDEVKCLSQFLSSFKELQTSGGGAEFFLQLLTQRASSSLFAFEQSLQRLGHTLRSAIAEAGASIAGPTAELLDQQTWASSEFDAMAAYKRLPWAEKSAALSVVNQCLDALESINTDEKLNSLNRLVRSIVDKSSDDTPMICVFSMYADTVSYLHTAIEDLGISHFKVTGANSFTERQATVERFVKEGGLILGTDGGLSEGIAMPQITHVIHYDLPSQSLVFERRRGRFDRFGRTKPLTMYVFRDESKAVPSESRLIDMIAANQDKGIDGVSVTTEAGETESV